jgi:18S rRNA (guanine1575-N7)-methyltransferase
MITAAAQRAGFGGGLVVDYPNSRKARKMYLVLMVGQQEVPQGLDGNPATEGSGVEGKRKRQEVLNERRRRKDQGGSGKKGKRGKKEVAAKDWILKKKELYRTRGKEG